MRVTNLTQKIDEQVVLENKDDGFRTHLGGSVIGRECARELWYSFRWSGKEAFNGRMLRLFARGQDEEARFIELLESVGALVWSQDAQGNQYRCTDHGGHFGGSVDGVARGLEVLPSTETPCLLEFKTHNDKSFQKLKSQTLVTAKYTHYVQMQIYMHKLELEWGLYCAVNKNDDELYFELVQARPQVAEKYLKLAGEIIFGDPPQKINESPGWFGCRFCTFKNTCHFPEKHKPLRNCRTCRHSSAERDGTWYCNLHLETLTKERQAEGCPQQAYHEVFE